MTSLHDLARRESAGDAAVEADITTLLQSGADPHAVDDNGDTAFNVAAANAPVCGRLMTRYWLQQALQGRGSRGLNDASGRHGSTLAQYIAKWSHDDEMEKDFNDGIAAGMRVDTPNASGWTPLMAACAMGRVKAVAFLSALYSRAALCCQATGDYSATYAEGVTVHYETGLNAAEIAQTRLFQSGDATPEDLAENLWECADIVLGHIQRKDA